MAKPRYLQLPTQVYFVTVATARQTPAGLVTTTQVLGLPRFYLSGWMNYQQISVPSVHIRYPPCDTWHPKLQCPLSRGGYAPHDSSTITLPMLLLCTYAARSFFDKGL